MKVTVVGMWGGFPKKDGPCSGYLIEKNGFRLLIDCGSGVAQHIHHYTDPNQLDHIVLSHYHYDHFSDTGVMLFSRLVNIQLKKTDELLHIYGPKDPLMEEKVNEVPYCKFHGYNAESKFQIGPFTIEFQQTVHPAETYAARITCEDGKVIAYTADASFTEELAVFCKDADLLIAECSLYDGMDGLISGHMTASEAGQLAQAAQAKETILTHLPHYGELEQLLTSAKEQGNSKIQLAKQGMIVNL